MRRKDPGPGLIVDSEPSTVFRSGLGETAASRHQGEVDRENSETVVVASHVSHRYTHVDMA